MCLNAAFMGGAKSILVPQFTPEEVAKLIRRKRPNFIVGVPTLFEALNRNPVFQNTDLSCIKAAFCGADTPAATGQGALRSHRPPAGGRYPAPGGLRSDRGGDGHHGHAHDRVTGIENSVGIPFPDMEARIVRSGTTEALPPGEEGEICLHGAGGYDGLS